MSPFSIVVVLHESAGPLPATLRLTGSAEDRAADAASIPRSSHTGWGPATDRPDPVGLLQEQNRTREPDLVPVRHGRMLN